MHTQEMCSRSESVDDDDDERSENSYVFQLRISQTKGKRCEQSEKRGWGIEGEGKKDSTQSRADQMNCIVSSNSSGSRVQLTILYIPLQRALAFFYRRVDWRQAIALLIIQIFYLNIWRLCAFIFCSEGAETTSTKAGTETKGGCQPIAKHTYIRHLYIYICTR